MLEKQRHMVIPRVLCFVFSGDEMLLMKGSSKKEWEGIYDPVGGHIEKGESVMMAARREIEEEAGIEVTDIKLKGIVHVTNFFGKNVMMFVTTSKATTKDVVGSDEGTPEWLKKQDLEHIRVFEDIKPMIDHIFSMKDDQIFVGTSEFDGKDKLLTFDVAIS